MNDSSKKSPADPQSEVPAEDKRSLLQAAKADLKQAKAAVKAARKTAIQAKEQVKALKTELRKSGTKKPKKSRKSN